MKRNLNIFTTWEFYLAKMTLLLFLNLPIVSSYSYLNVVQIDKSEDGKTMTGIHTQNFQF